MLMKSVKGSLAFLISFSLLALVVPFSAQADVSTQPQIIYSDNTGLNFAVAPASISGVKSPNNTKTHLKTNSGKNSRI